MEETDKTKDKLKHRKKYLKEITSEHEDMASSQKNLKSFYRLKSSSNSLEANWFSLEQNSCSSFRQAFISCCRLHQVWKGTEKKLHLYGFKEVLCACSDPPRGCEGKWTLLELGGQLGFLEGGVGIIDIAIAIIIIIDMPF